MTRVGAFLRARPLRTQKRHSIGTLKTFKTSRSPSVPVCAVCGATVDLWNYGEALVHRECASRLPKAEAADELTLAYQQVSAEPDSAGCSVTIVAIPREAGRYKRTFAHLQLRPPALVPIERWRRCVEDGQRFLAKWGEQAQALGWTSADLFGLHMPPANPHPSYRRPSRIKPGCAGCSRAAR